MFTSSRILLATVSTGKSGAGVVKRKSKWIDRRAKTPPNGGREVFPYNQMPACQLCHMKFKFKQDYATHTESEIHKDRVKWAEMNKWWTDEGLPALKRHQNGEWDWFVKNVAEPEAAKLGISVDEYIKVKRYRSARIDEDTLWHAPVQSASTKPEVAEPRDNRWPMSPKW